VRLEVSEGRGGGRRDLVNFLDYLGKKQIIL